MELPKQRRQEMRPLSPEEAERFRQAAEQDRWGVLFTFALATGMRPSEYVGLQWKDVDLKAGTATVQRSLTRNPNGRDWQVNEHKTARGRRTIPLPPSVTRALVEHRKRPVEERLAAGPAYATLLLAAGVNPKIVSERLGHASVSMTLDTYSHVLPTMQADAADKLERLLFGTQ